MEVPVTVVKSIISRAIWNMVTIAQLYTRDQPVNAMTTCSCTEEERTPVEEATP